MKTKFLLLSVVMLSIVGCRSKDHILALPETKDVGTATHGAFMEVKLLNKTSYKGELIAVHPKELFVLNKESGELYQLARNEVNSYQIIFAKSSYNYGWTIAVLPALTILHGYLASVTLPTTLITTLLVHGTNNQGHGFSHNQLPIEELYKFARFPQGIPTNVPLHKIK